MVIKLVSGKFLQGLSTPPTLGRRLGTELW